MFVLNSQRRRLEFGSIILKPLVFILLKVCQLLVAGCWLSVYILVFSNDKTDCHNLTEILLKVVLNTNFPINFT
jgi:hypothetical protein